MFRNPIALIALTFGVTIAAKDPTNYVRNTEGKSFVSPFIVFHHHNQYASLGPYGTFELEISGDGSSMKWASTLESIDELEETLNVSIPALTYHLHQQWISTESDYAVGGNDCGPAVTGGHYDPFLGCGPASGVSQEQCLAIDKARTADRYNCSPEVYSGGAYFECEVGDLSGKNGPITVSPDGKAIKILDAADPLAAIATQYVEERVASTPDKFGSIVFHIGSPRVLCGKLMKGIPPQGSSFEDSKSSSTLRSVSMMSFTFAALFHLIW